MPLLVLLALGLFAYSASGGQSPLRSAPGPVPLKAGRTYRLRYKLNRDVAPELFDTLKSGYAANMSKLAGVLEISRQKTDVFITMKMLTDSVAVVGSALSLGDLTATLTGVDTIATP